MKKTLLAVILTLCMIFTIMPITAFAADVTEHDISKNSIIITENGNYLITQSNSETATYYTITVEAETANITIKDINIEAADGSAFSISPTSTVELTISGANTLTSGYGYAGLWVPTGATVTILSTDGSTADSLTANGGDNGAGIGGSDKYTVGDNSATCGTVNIKSGTINAIGGDGGAGIGGGYYGDGGDITISAEEGCLTTVTATGGHGSAGIGGGNGDGGNITISAKEGGSITVTATGGYGSAVIGGGGATGNSGDITISAEEGGSTKVDTTGGDSVIGIGSGYRGDCGKIEIKGSTVVAKGNNLGIGSSNNTGSINISDSTIIATGEDGAIYAEEVTFAYNVDYIWRTGSTDLFTNSTTPYIWDNEDLDTYLEIQIPVADIELDMTTLALNVGDSDTLTATITPSTASDKTITWTSSNESVATVDENGQVVAVGVGEATITATSGDMTATCEITVTEPIPEETNGITGFLRMIKMILELIIYIFGLFAG